jgi:hypothetical protein
MKDIILTVVTILGIFVVLPLLILWIRDKIAKPSRKQIDDYSRRFKERLSQPHLDEVAKHFGCALPQALIALYQNQEEVMRDNFEVAPSPDAPEGSRWFISFYEPADAQSTRDVWPGCEKYFQFANDGCGNGYLVYPTLEDPPVNFHDHETGEITHVCDTLSQFMAWPRLLVKE